MESKTRTLRYSPTYRLSDSDWLGFDLDHALLRYKVQPLMKLIHDSLIAALETEAAIPASLFSAEPYRVTGPDGQIELAPYVYDANFLAKGLIADFITGDLLKLDSDGHVRRACHGYSGAKAWLAGAEVASRYGDAPWRGYELLRGQKRHASFFVLITYFDMPCQPLIARLVEWMDAQAQVNGRGSPHSAPSPRAVALAAAEAHVHSHATAHANNTSTSASHSKGTTARDNDATLVPYASIFTSLMAAFNYIFDNIQGFQGGRGGFFHGLKSEPSTYICERPSLAACLKARRLPGSEKRVHTFLATNSHKAFAEFLLEAALDTGWRDCFDLVIYNTLKPAWFKQISPFYVLDATTHQETTFATELQLGKRAPLYAQGNAAALQCLCDALILWRQQTAPVESEGDNALPVYAQLDAKGHIVHVLGRRTCQVETDSISSEEKLRVPLPHTHPHLFGSAGLASAQNGVATTDVKPPLSSVALQLVDGLAERTDAGTAQPPEDADVPALPRRAKIVYFGDHIHGDVVPAAKDAGWAAVAVVEECESALPVKSLSSYSVATHDAGPEPNFRETYALASPWGSFFAAAPSDSRPSYFAALLEQHAVAAVSDLETAVVCGALG